MFIIKHACIRDEKSKLLFLSNGQSKLVTSRTVTQLSCYSLQSTSACSLGTQPESRGASCPCQTASGGKFSRWELDKLAGCGGPSTGGGVEPRDAAVPFLRLGTARRSSTSERFLEQYMYWAIWFMSLKACRESDL